MKSKKTRELYSQYVESFKRDMENAALDLAETVEHWTDQKVLNIYVDFFEKDEKEMAGVPYVYQSLPNIYIESTEDVFTPYYDEFYDGIIIKDGKYQPVSISLYIKEKMRDIKELAELLDEDEFIFNIEELKMNLNV